MQTLLLKNNAGLQEINIPDNCEELKLRQYIKFIVAYNAWINSLKENNDIISYETVISLANIVAKTLEVDLKTILGLEIDFLDIIEGAKILSNAVEEDEDDEEDRIQAKYELNGKLMSIVVHLNEVIQSVKPKPLTYVYHSFEYKDEEFFMPYWESKEFLKAMTRPSIPLGEVIEIMEIKRLSGMMVEQNGDPEGSYMYTEALRVIATLAKKQHEKLPSSGTDKFIAERMKYFEDISFQQYADINFFLSSIGLTLKMTSNSITSLILLKELALQKNKMN